jgi:hypothetical protein
MTNEAPDDDDRTVIRPQGGAWPQTQRAGAPPPPPVPDTGGNLPVGTRLAEFEITALIGEGGFGIVYMARDHSLHRNVALKEYMPSSLAARAGGSQVQVRSERHRETFHAGLNSFINEARLLASFDHPSLVKVYRFWEANGTAYMVMPLLDGLTLKDVLKGQAQRPDEGWLLSVLGPLTEALLVIHAEQCFHRDIAPDNVMLLPSVNRWLLLDFGAARRVIGDMTQALTVILKPGYAPVEQYAEVPNMKQGPWTDVYALAAVVYFAIMGRTPPDSVSRSLNDTYVPLVQAAKGRYSERFLAAIDHALAVRPAERTQSIGALRDELGLGGVTAEQPVARPVSPVAEPPRRAGGTAAPAAANPAAAPGKGQRTALAMGIGVVVLAGLGYGAYALLSPKSRPAVVEQASVTPLPTPPASAAPAMAAPATPAPPPNAPPPAPAAAGFDVPQQFAAIVKAQTPGFDVHLQADRSTYRIDRDELSFTIQSDREGYVYVFMYGTDQTLTQLYPNIELGSIKIRKGQVLKLPQRPLVLTASGPPGPTELLVMVSPRQRDHSAMRPRKDGALRVFPTGAEAATLAAATGGAVPLAGKVICPANAACDDEFGAAAVRVEVVP